GSSIPGKLPEQVFPDATTCPADKPIIDRRSRDVLGRAIAPATTALHHMHVATDDAPIVRSHDTSHIRWQTRPNPLPLLIAQPIQVLAHDPDPSTESGSYGIRIAISPH